MSILSDGLLALTGLAAAGVAVRAWRNRPTAGAAGIAGFAASIAIWSLGHVAEHHTAGAAGLAFEKLQWTGLVPAAFLWFAFVLDYTGREAFLRRWYLAVLFAPPALLVALLWLPAGSTLSVWPGFDAEHGLAFWSHIGLSYGLLAVGSALLVARVALSPVPFRRQGLAVLAALAAGWGATVIGVFEPLGDFHFHAMPVGFALMAGLLLAAVVRGGLSGIAPIARRTVVRRLAAGVVALDDECRVTEINPAARRLLGIAAETTVVGRRLEAVVDVPELDSLLASLDTLAPAQPSSPAPSDGGRPSTEIRHEDRIVECELSALYDDLDRPVGGVLLLRDVTAVRRRHDRLERQNERLDAFTGVVSHDLRNPLAVAVGQVSLARDACECGHAVDHLDAAARAHDRMDDLIDDLLTLARQDEGAISPATVALPSAVADCRERIVPDDAALETSVAEASVRADPDRLRQLLENLLENALEHAGSDVSITVGVLEGSRTAPVPDGTGRARAPASGFYLADDGPGIPEDERDQVLEAGYSTAEDGTGFGLRVVREIALAHDWTVTVTESEAGGARFEFTGVDVIDPS